MIDAESRYVAQEFDDCLVCSVTELRERAGGGAGEDRRRRKSLANTLARLPDRERLALQFRLASDVLCLGLLYEAFTRSSEAIKNATGARRPATNDAEGPDDVAPALVVKQSLFD